MNKITTRVVSRAAVAATLSIGMAVGAVGVASASPISHDRASHSGPKWNQSQNKVEGIVSSYVAGTSISILVHGATTPTTFNLSSTTVVNGLATGATVAALDNVDLVLSDATPAIVKSITVDTAQTLKVEGIVSSYVAGTSISITTPGATSPTMYTLTSATTITGLATGATLAAGAEVDLVLSGATPVSVASIKVDAPKTVRVEGIVSTYVAGALISITTPGATLPTMYTLTSATTITGLATGAMLAVGAQVNLVLSTTTPVTVTAINVDITKPVRVEAVVSTYTAGSSITVLVNGSTTPTTYTLTSATTITGLATGATLASPTNVDLVLSTTTPATVTSIFVEVKSEGNGRGNGGTTTSDSGKGDSGRHGSRGAGSSKHDGGRR